MVKVYKTFNILNLLHKTFERRRPIGTEMAAKGTIQEKRTQENRELKTFKKKYAQKSK